MGNPLQTIEYKDFGGGLNLKSSPTKVAVNEASISKNISYSVDGSFRTRLGSRIQNINSQFVPVPMTDTPETLGLFDYRRSDGVTAQVIAAGTKIKHDLNTPVAQNNFSTGVPIALSALLPTPDMEFFVNENEEVLLYGNGIDNNLKYNGTQWTNWNLPTPLAPTLADLAAGVLPAGEYAYYYSFVRVVGATVGSIAGTLVGGVIVQEGELNPDLGGATPGPAKITIAANRKVSITRSNPADAQVNGWVIYRKSPTSTGSYYQLIDDKNRPIVIDISQTVYTDNIAVDGTIFAEFDNSPAPKSQVFEECFGRMFIAPKKQTIGGVAYKESDLYYSKPGRYGNVPLTNFFSFDGRIVCLKRIFGILFIGTDRSLWVWPGDPTVEEPRRFSSQIGVLNNRCAGGESFLYIVASNKKIYRFGPTDFSQKEIRIDDPYSVDVESILNIAGFTPDRINCEYFTSPTTSQFVVAIPYGSGAFTNNAALVLNETESIIQNSPVWEFVDNWNISAMKTFLISNQNQLISGDYNGLLWRLYDPTIYGDGAALNGTATAVGPNFIQHIVEEGLATSGTTTTLVDTSKNFTSNAFSQKVLDILTGANAGLSRTILSNTTTQITVSSAFPFPIAATDFYRIGNFQDNSNLYGMIVHIVGGAGAGQARTIVSNSSTNIVVSPNFSPALDTTSQYTVGGYEVIHGTPWLSVLDSYEILKQLWFIWINANANGDYNIELYIETAFNQSLVPSQKILVNLRAFNTVWGLFTWGQAIWGAQAVFRDRFRYFTRFNAIRLIFTNKLAAQPFQVNTVSLSVQNKALFFRST